jgi:hypothetical protein
MSKYILQTLLQSNSLADVRRRNGSGYLQETFPAFHEDYDIVFVFSDERFVTVPSKGSKGSNIWE